MSFGGELSDDIAKDASAAIFEARLERMSTIGDVTVTRQLSRSPLAGVVAINTVTLIILVMKRIV